MPYPTPQALHPSHVFRFLCTFLCAAQFLFGATGTPGQPQLSPDKWDGSASYTITMNMWWGNNGTTWNLYENNVLVHTAALADHSPLAQTAAYAFTNKTRGTYVYTSTLTNSFGTTAGGAFTYSVTQGPATPPPPTDTPSLTLGEIAHPAGRYFSGYYPSWSDNWFSSVNWDGSKKTDNEIYLASQLAQVPGVYTHLLLSFAQPNFQWSGLSANQWNGTGLNFTAKPADIKESIRLLHVLNKKVILAVGGATYNDWNALANEAGLSGAQAPIKAAFTRLLDDLSLDGFDVDYEVEGADPANVSRYARAIQALREAVDASNAPRLLTLAAWSTGADYTAATPHDSGYPGTPSYWAGSAGRERLVFQHTVTSGPHAGRRINELLDLVNVMAYDAQTLHFDPVTAYDQYRALLPAATPVSIGLEIPPEGWAGGILVINNSDASAPGTIVLADQYGRSPRGPYSVERSVGQVIQRTINPHDGAMLWHVLKTTSVSAGAAQSANAQTVAAKIAALFGYTPRSP